MSCSSNLFNGADTTSKNDGGSRDDEDDDEKETKTKRRREMDGNGGGMVDDVDDVAQKTKTPTINSFRVRNARCWIYVTGLHLKFMEDEVVQYFSKVGIIGLNTDKRSPVFSKHPDGVMLIKFVQLCRHDK